MKGCLFAFLAILQYSLGNIIIKNAKFSTAPEQNSMRYLVNIILIGILIKFYFKQNIFGPKDKRLRILMTVRGAFEMSSGTVFLYGLTYIDPSDVMALRESGVIIVAIFSRILLKEKLDLSHILAITLSVSGVLLISKPTFVMNIINNLENQKETLQLIDKMNLSNITVNNTLLKLIESNIKSTNNERSQLTILIGVIFELSSAFLDAGAYIVQKMISNKNVHFSLSAFYSGLTGLPFNIIVSIIQRIHEPLIQSKINLNFETIAFEIFIMLSFSIFLCMSGFTFNIGFNYENASILAIVATTGVPLIFILQYLFLSIQFNYYSVIGSFLIIFGSVYIIIHKTIDINLHEIEKNNQKLQKSVTRQFIKKTLFWKF